ncbi:hypothetical protein [Streptomyces sp. Rer75]|nr:hypothetical protein [Streptomyces sp. Rer75]
MTGALGTALIDPVHMLAERAMANGDAVPEALDADPESVACGD